MLVAQTACRLAAEGKTLLDGLEDIYNKYGCYLEKTISFTLSGIEGMQKIKDTMDRLAKQIGEQKVVAMRNYNTKECNRNGVITIMDLPKSNVLYYELENGWACVRPSGTEPKLKVYIGVKGACINCAKKALAETEKALNEIVGL